MPHEGEYMGLNSKLKAFVCRRVEELVDRHAAFREALCVMLVKEVVEHSAIALDSVRPKILAH
jgi:hypothetical protein